MAVKALLKLISCPAPRLPLSWHSQHHSWRSKQGTCGRGVKALCRCGHVSLSLPSDPRGSFFPAHHDLTLGCFLVGTLQTFWHMAAGVRWDEREASLPPRGHLCVLFVSASGELLALTYPKGSPTYHSKCRGLHPDLTVRCSSKTAVLLPVQWFCSAFS